MIGYIWERNLYSILLFSLWNIVSEFKKKDLVIYFMTTLSLSSEKPEEVIRSYYSWFLATTWLLEIELRT